MDHVITTYGGGELFALVFNGIAALFKQDSTGMVMPLIRVGLMVGLVYTVILMFFRSSIVEGLHWILWVVIATNLLFLPKTTVFIHDPLTKERFKIDNVPLTLGVFASFVSHAGKTITEKVESVFSLPDYMPYHETGTVFASSLMLQLGQFRITDPLFKGNMERFVNQCLVYDVMIGHKYTLSDLQNTPDIWQLVSSQASPVLGFMYREGKSPGSVVTCKAGAQKLNTLWNSEIKRAVSIYGSRIQNRTLTESAFNTGLLGSARLLMGSTTLANSAMDILRQEMIIHAIEESSNNKLSELGSSKNYAATKALLQQRSTYAIAGDIAARTLPLFKNVIEAFSYALFIFIVVLALLPNGYKIISTYFGILVWTQLWAPLYAVLNLIMTLYGRSETSSLIGSQGLTLLNSSAIINANADMVTLAAWLAMSIPFISYGILKQGASAFVGLAHHLGSAMQSSASSVASEAVSGNISLGNVSLGTQAYQNTTAFQHHTSPSYSDSQFKALSASGIEQSSFGGGTQTVHDHTIPNLPLKLMASVNTSQEHQQRLHEAQSLAESKNMAAGQSMESALQQTSNVLSRLGSDLSKHENYSNTLTTNESKALQDHTNFTKDISESLGVSQSRAHEIAVAVKANTPDWYVSAGISTTTSGSTSHQEQFQKAKSIAQQKEYSYSLDSVLSASKSIMESKNDTQGAELASGAHASLNQANHLREEASLAHTRVKEASDAFASSQRKDFQETRDITHPFLEYVAKQPVNRGPEQASSPMGMMQAAAILKAGGEDYQTYLEGFKKDNPQYEIQRVSTGESQQGLQDQYATKSTSFKANQLSLESHHNQHKESIGQQGKELGLTPEKVTSSSIKNEILQKRTEVEARLEARHEGINNSQSSLETKVDAARSENVILGNAKQVWNSTSEAAVDIYKTVRSRDSSKAKPASVASASVNHQPKEEK